MAFLLPAGLVAAALAGPWLAVTAATALAAGRRWVKDPDRFQPSARHATEAAVAFLGVGAAFALTDRLGVQPFGFSATIILLTAVHFHFAGFVLPLAGALAYARRPRRWLELGIGAVVVGIPITALGFFDLPLANWVGAVLTATGGLAIGMGTLAIAGTLHGRTATALAIIAGFSLLISMPLAIAYATGTLTGATWIDLDVMTRVHGGLNALGFATTAMVAWSLDRLARRITTRGGPAGPLDVLRFNLRPFVMGPVVAIAAGTVALAPLPQAVQIVLAATAVGATILTALAVTAIVWVFAVGARHRWDWVRTASASPKHWINITTGFDDSTETLRRLLPASRGEAFDVFDPTIEHESALLTARSRYRPSGGHGSTGDLARSLGSGTSDAAYLLMSAHEARGSDRAALFGAISEALTATGRLILVEHLRDLPNRIAFGPGANHFQTRDTWLQAIGDAGLVPIDEARLTPYVRGFVFGRVTP